MREENRQSLSSRGFVVYLHCTPEQQCERTFRDRNRPLLQTDNPLEKLRDLMDIREPLYRQTADLVVSTEGRNTQSVVREIVKYIDSSD